MKLIADISEFIAYPRRTGIQRVVGELLRRLPKVQPAMMASHRSLSALPPAFTTLIAQYFTQDNNLDELAAEVQRMGAETAATAPPLDLSAVDSILLPEVFGNPDRVASYRAMDPLVRDKVHTIVYDLIPLTHPGYVHLSWAVSAWRYFHLLGLFRHHSFISRQVRQDFYWRLLRKDEGSGPVLRLGSDGLGRRSTARTLQGRRKKFVMLGNLEPRKRAELALEAFASVADEHPDLELRFMGARAIGDAFFARMESLRQRTGRVSWLCDPPDSVVRREFEDASASVFISSAEGFGLPAVESLWLGVPVIAAHGIPSLEEVGERGVVLVDRTVEAVANAMVRFEDDTFCQQKSLEAASLDLPTWAGMASQVEEWLSLPVADK